MSIPSLSQKGGLFLVFPCLQAAAVLGKAEREYIANVLMKLVNEVPAAGKAAKAVQMGIRLDQIGSINGAGYVGQSIR